MLLQAFGNPMEKVGMSEQMSIFEGGAAPKGKGRGGRGGHGGGGGSDGSAGGGGERPTDLAEEARRRYLNYALSVITSRALPDVRDGLKPVQRRILYAMWNDERHRHDAKYRKCAKVVGTVMGQYHPHGDTAIYDALVRMAQDFSLRYPLVDGHGNFGSLDGDSPAAMRYTECRLAALADRAARRARAEDGRRSGRTTTARRFEPIVLPARSRSCWSTAPPASRSAWPPTSRRTTWARSSTRCVELIDDPKLETKDLLKYIKGPDFPTGGQMLNSKKELQGDLRDRAGRDPPARRVEARGAAARRPATSSSPRSPTR